MTRTVRNLIAATAAALALLSTATARAESADAAFDQVGASYAAAHQSRWINPLRPEAAGDYVAVAESADAKLNRLVAAFRPAEARWINALRPEASGDAVMVARSESADAQFIRQITYYTRGMLDRGGWVNAYAPDTHYAAPHALLAVAVGEGATLVAA